MDSAAPAEPWNRFRRTLRNSLSSALKGQRGPTRELPGMFLDELKNHAHLLVEIPECAWSGGEAGCVPWALRP